MKIHPYRTRYFRGDNTNSIVAAKGAFHLLNDMIYSGSDDDDREHEETKAEEGKGDDAEKDQELSTDYRTMLI